MKKRFLAVFLVLALCVGLAPSAAFADDAPSGSDLTQLAAPTGLEWGKEYRLVNEGEWTTYDRPGSVIWTVPEGGACQNDFTIKFYRVGEDGEGALVHNAEMSYPGDYSDRIFHDGAFIYDNERFDSGSYYFTVQSKGDGIDYTDSEIAVSEVWNYVKPDDRMPTISADSLVWKTDDLPNWVTNAMAIWTVPDGVSPWDPDDPSTWTRVQINFFFSETEDGEPQQIGGYSDVGAFSDGEEILDSYIASHGAGYYYFKIRLAGNPITEYRNGEWSGFSPALDLTGTVDSVKDALGDILSSADSAGVVDAVKELDRNELRTSMLADSDVLDLIERLEAKTGVAVSVNAEEENLPESFKEVLTGGNVKISGAALNELEDDVESITLNVSQPENPALVIPELYKQTMAVSFSMGLDGVKQEAPAQGGSAQLAVPVRVTLPIPRTINPEFLVILHYAADGTPEVLQRSALHIERVDGQAYVSFMLDHFSDFVMTELAEQGGGNIPVISVIQPNPSDDETPDETEPTAPVFADVDANAYYADPVAWAVENGVTTGTTDTTFSPKETCTHGQILTFLWRAAGEPESSAQSPIAMEGDEFYCNAVKWAAEKGMIGGDFDPKADCTRADAVNYIWQAADKGAASYDGQFTDVPAGAAYAQAVAWALEQGVTTGTSATTFTPDKICSRGEIVTFLYRAYK